jgi:hypothetical protein
MPAYKQPKVPKSKSMPVRGVRTMKNKAKKNK